MVNEDSVVTKSRPEPPIVVGPRSFEGLFHDERDRLYGAMCLLTGDRPVAEDLTQDAFVRVYERWQHVRDLDDPVGYLYRTAMNGYRSHYRRSMLALRRSVTFRHDRDGIALAEAQAEIVRRLGHLTKKQRASIVLLDLLELSSEDAGKLLRMSPGAVRTQASRARAELRRMAGDDDA